MSAGNRACLECRHFCIVASEESGYPRLGECRARPPQVFMLAQNAANLAGKVGVQVHFPAAWPQVQPLSWCSSFEPKEQGAANA